MTVYIGSVDGDSSVEGDHEPRTSAHSREVFVNINSVPNRATKCCVILPLLLLGLKVYPAARLLV